MRPADIEDYALAEYALAESRNYRAELSRIPMKLVGKYVLDLAAGPGTWTRLFAEAGAAKVVWTDRSKRFLDLARKYVSGNPRQNKIAFAISDLVAAPFKDEVFDVVYCRLGLHHSTDERRTLAEIERVLRKGGLMVLVAHRRGLITEKGPRGPKRLLQYVSPYLKLLIQKKGVPARYHIERVLYSRIRRAGLFIEFVDTASPTSLYLLARKPVRESLNCFVPRPNEAQIGKL